MNVTEKDVFAAMLDAAEAKSKNEVNYRVRSKQFGMNPADDTSLDDYYLNQMIEKNFEDDDYLNS